ncbi:MAG: transcription antitermination factor NusB [Saprospiraceae bacterium]
MLSRRNVRIKVMQVLYSMSRDEKLDLNGVLRRYTANVDKSFELYLFNLLLLTRIANFSKQDRARKRSKLLPSEEDLSFEAKLGENPLVESLVNNAELSRLYKKYKLEGRVDKDMVRRFYADFAKTEEYQAFLQQKESSQEDFRDVLLALYKHCIGNEAFEEYLDDNYSSWTDDKSLIVGAMKKTIKALPASPDFYEAYQPGDETVKDFGEILLMKVVREDDDLLAIIEPTLRNWDVDRVAIIDMILLKMALCELMHFSTIPTKVTLNEFVEISKIYSTEKSKDFINGILDRLMKQLETDGKINKKGRGLVD